MLTGLIAFILGASIGSFLNVSADRLPAGRSVISPRSHCDNCGRKLSALEMVPVASYLWLRGRCRNCRAKVPRRVVVVEAGTGLIFTGLYLGYGFGLEFVVLAGYASLFLLLAVIDLEHGLILNKLTYPAALASLALAPFWPDLGIPRSFMGGDTAWPLLLGALAGGFLFLLPFFLIALFNSNAMGWGDVKMAGVIGLAAGFPMVLVAMMVSFVSGGMVAVILLLARRKGRKEAIPFGPFLAAGGIVALVWGQPLIDWYLGLYPPV
ncbi:MAG: prepilin peptidase [Chloroflexi bacterium]|nr:prepilin peptidase [Chloroflexota bacterium]